MKLAHHFRALTALPCWGVDWDPPVNLSLNFGKPRLKIREPIRDRPGRSPALRLAYSHRQIVVRGQWWLWLFWSRWTLSIRGLEPVRSTSSRRRIQPALRLLDGQRLVDATLLSRARTRFEFDLGAVLDVRGLDNHTDEAVWSLYQPRGRILSIRTDDSFSFGPGNKPSKYQPIETLPESLANKSLQTVEHLGRSAPSVVRR